MIKSHGVRCHPYPSDIANFLQSTLSFIEIYVETCCARPVQKDDGVSLLLSLSELQS